MGSLTLAVRIWLKSTRLGTWLRRKRLNARITSAAYCAKWIGWAMPPVTPDEKNRIVADMLDAARKYRFKPKEYFCYYFMYRTEEERKRFCSDLNWLDICESLNRARNLPIFRDKIRTYERFSRFYGRELCGVRSRRDQPALKAFASRHPVMIVKPVDDSDGHGIRRVDLSEGAEMEAVLQELVQKYCQHGGQGFVAEELVVQEQRMAALHPTSVNTLRVMTIRCDDGIEYLPAYVRMGCKGSLVDNAGAGGIFGAVDMQTGRIIAAADGMGRSCRVHPDTGVELPGYEIPRFDEALALAAELAQVVPDNRYTGWDLALTEDGWIMIEGNAHGQFGCTQIALQEGCMDEINRILRRLGRPEWTKTGI